MCLAPTEALLSTDLVPNEALLSMGLAPNEALRSMDLTPNEALLSMVLAPNDALLSTELARSWDDGWQQEAQAQSWDAGAESGQSRTTVRSWDDGPPAAGLIGAYSEPLELIRQQILAGVLH